VVEQLKILFLSPEAVPFAKTGGLADVAGSLPEALNRLGLNIRLLLPLYTMVRESKIKLHLLFNDLKVPLGGGLLSVRVWEAQTREGVPVYFIEREDMFDRPQLYGTALGDYHDNLERFTVYSHGALRIAEELSFAPDVIHCNDWQSGLVPALLKGPYSNSPFVGNARTIFTIHNLGYQGIFPVEKLWLTGLPREAFFHPEGLEFWGKISLLKAGIVYADSITTVSPTYAREIQTDNAGMGMEGILHHRRSALTGIVNGVDYHVWNPAEDRCLTAPYSLKKIAGKRRCKEALIKEMQLDRSLTTQPLLAMISRLDTQKGLDLLIKILDNILSLNVGLVILGAGDASIQEALKTTATNNPGRVALTVGFDEPLAHRIMAGADMLLIPSRYEPCGLTQMYALKYGTIPVVRATGGLDDTITPFNPQTGKGNGFKFTAYKPKAFLRALQKAVELFHNAGAWRKLRTNAMKEDFSWDRSARSYLELYNTTMGKT
jgi:starch synthase